MTIPTLVGRRVLVAGASSGIGRALAVAAVRAGADVVLAARTEERLDDAVKAAGGGTVISADLATAAGCRLLAQETARCLGGVDLVVYTAACAPLRRIEDTSAEEWEATLATNVVGFNLLTAALLPSLPDGAIVAALSSEAVDRPRFGLAAYGAGKAALDHALSSWRVEHPELRFSRVTLGSTVPTGMGDDFDPELLGTAVDVWAADGVDQQEYMRSDDVVEVLLGLLATALAVPGVAVEHLSLRSPTPPPGRTGQGER